MFVWQTNRTTVLLPCRWFKHSRYWCSILCICHTTLKFTWENKRIRRWLRFLGFILWVKIYRRTPFVQGWGWWSCGGHFAICIRGCPALFGCRLARRNINTPKTIGQRRRILFLFPWIVTYWKTCRCFSYCSGWWHLSTVFIHWRGGQKRSGDTKRRRDWSTLKNSSVK